MPIEYQRRVQDRFVVVIVDDEICHTLLSVGYSHRLFAFRADETSSLHQLLGSTFKRSWEFVAQLGAGVEVWPFSHSDPLGRIRRSIVEREPRFFPERVFLGEAKGEDWEESHLDVALIDVNLRGREAASSDDLEVTQEGMYLARNLMKVIPGGAYLVYSGFPLAETVLRPFQVGDLSELEGVAQGFHAIDKKGEKYLITSILKVLEARRRDLIRGWTRDELKRGHELAGRALAALDARGGDDLKPEALKKIEQLLSSKVSHRWSLGRLFFQVGASARRLTAHCQEPDKEWLREVSPEEEVEFLREGLRGIKRALKPTKAVVRERCSFDDLTEEYMWAFLRKMPLLLEGEIGTGKTTLGERIHGLSGRQGKYLNLNCAELTDVHEFERSLFGVSSGTYTQVGKSQGLLAQADLGTVLLDEIHRLPKQVAGALLRFMDDYTIRPLGGAMGEFRKLDVRLLFATSENLQAWVDREDFSAALFSRIGIVRITVPPLRTRPHDVPDLVEEFRRRWARRESIPETEVPNFSEHALNALQRQAWPFNVRDLRCAVDTTLSRCFYQAAGQPTTVEPADLMTQYAEPAPERATEGEAEAIFLMALEWLVESTSTSFDELVYLYGQRAMLMLVARTKQGVLPAFRTVKLLAKRLGVTQSNLNNRCRTIEGKLKSFQ